ncbi:hypothetical protein LTR56_009593 [Elasticomyces elasticus]|nr:hypothetical protein LTR56_009593 [Elasticomyces elasticus]KAK3657272.1 hypothetical protein LTR22_009446 [Elasticomyces elasticus]KAK4922181.1 hypothetical protein LTR49_010402 [Elasticomyces elasticus]KAK4960060.1 hypothetical protein LTR10_002951 [Elasticomyces elasticus]KAK4967712.1 hypothetical protein LTR42_010037 [Elasticomyces elasticus]
MASKDSDMVATTDTSFRLLSLPPELWSRICRLAVTRQDPILFTEAMSPREVETLVKQPAITLVCKTIREETIDLFYANSFVFRDRRETEHKLWTWLRALCVEGRVKYSLPNLVIKSRFYLDDKHIGTALKNNLRRVGMSLRKFEEEPDLASIWGWQVYKLVPTVASRLHDGIRSEYARGELGIEDGSEAVLQTGREASAGRYALHT